MYQLSEYFFTASDLRYFIRASIKLVRSFTKRDWKGIGIIVGAMLVLGVLTDFTRTDIFFWCFLFAMFYWNWDSRVSIGLGIAGLVIIPLFIFLSEQNILLLGDIWAENIAVCVFFFLCIGVIKQLWEYRVPPRPLPTWDEIPIARHFVKSRLGEKRTQVKVKAWKLKKPRKRK